MNGQRKKTEDGLKKMQRDGGVEKDLEGKEGVKGRGP